MRRIGVTLLFLAAVGAALVAGAGDRVGRFFLSVRVPSVAAAMMRDPAWRGVALYSEGRWGEAIAAFRGFHTNVSDYNLGNALAQTGQFAAAIEAYDKALDQAPDNNDAKYNRALVIALITAQQNESNTAAPGGANSKLKNSKMRGDTDDSDNAESNSYGPEGRVGKHEVKSDSGQGGGAAVHQSLMSSFGATASETFNGAEGGAGSGGGSKGSNQMTLLENTARFGKKAEASSAHPDIDWLKTLPDEGGRFLRELLMFEHTRRVESGAAPPITGDPW